jgi:nitroimidazol reductase NimA-like FMN-containing flavoprotein (pyridoxamine 5'-phosphate oxidase superfamily)
MFGTLSNKEIEQVLHDQYLGRIGCHAENLTYVVPISYAYDGQSIYCHTQEGMKTKMMRKNPYVCFQVDSFEAMAAWKSVIAWGKFEELTKPAAREEALKILLNRNYPIISSQKMHLGEDWPFWPDDLNDIGGIVFKIELDRKTGRYEINDYISGSMEEALRQASNDSCVL